MHDLPARGRLAGPALALAVALIAAACGGAAPSAPPTGAPGEPPPPSAPDGARIVEPRPGQLDVHDVPAESLVATLDGRRLTVAVTWWSGIEPCTILDSVIVAKEDGGYAITLREGRGPEEVVCAAIAEQHRTLIEFPDELDPGTYTIRDGAGGAPAIEVVVS